jgi:hypothetical protein
MKRCIITAIDFPLIYPVNGHTFQMMIGAENGRGKMINHLISHFLLTPEDTLVEVVNWWRIDFGDYGLEWLTVRVNKLGGGRETVTFVWDSSRFKELWKRLWGKRDDR